MQSLWKVAFAFAFALPPKIISNSLTAKKKKKNQIYRKKPKEQFTTKYATNFWWLNVHQF